MSMTHMLAAVCQRQVICVGSKVTVGRIFKVKEGQDSGSSVSQDNGRDSIKGWQAPGNVRMDSSV